MWKMARRLFTFGRRFRSLGFALLLLFFLKVNMTHSRCSLSIPPKPHPRPVSLYFQLSFPMSLQFLQMLLPNLLNKESSTSTFLAERFRFIHPLMRNIRSSSPDPSLPQVPQVGVSKHTLPNWEVSSSAGYQMGEKKNIVGPFIEMSSSRALQTHLADGNHKVQFQGSVGFCALTFWGWFSLKPRALSGRKSHLVPLACHPPQLGHKLE